MPFRSARRKQLMGLGVTVGRPSYGVRKKSHMGASMEEVNGPLRKD